jgi:hypothetical protein
LGFPWLRVSLADAIFRFLSTGAQKKEALFFP